MNGWWESFSIAQQIFWAIAVFSSFFLLIQLVMTFVGLDGDGADFEADVDIDAESDVEAESESDHKSFLRFFTVRNFVAFFTGFSWVGLACLDIGLPLILAIPIGIGAGTTLAAILMTIMIILSHLKSKGNVSLKNAIGHTGTVTIKIGENFSSAGKVSVSFHGGLREVRAITPDVELHRGDPIEVVDLIDNQLVVRRIEN